MGAAAAVVLVFVLPARAAARRAAARSSRPRRRPTPAYGLPVALSLILALALATTDRFLIASFLGDAAVGVYHAGYSLANRTLDVMFIWLGAAGGPALIVALERGGARGAAEGRPRAGRADAGADACRPSVGLALVARPLADVMVGPALRDGAARRDALDRRQRALFAG